MISLRDNMPLISHGEAYTTGFEDHWLQNALMQAAHKAGYENWWLAGHVTESVKRFLDGHYHGTVVTTARLHKAVRSVLQVIGYGEVAEYFAPSPPPVTVPLAELADKAGNGYELAFFDLLSSEIDKLQGAGITNMRFSGLPYAVKKMCEAKRWKSSCTTLRNEILYFLRARLSSGSGDGVVAFSLS